MLVAELAEQADGQGDQPLALLAVGGVDRFEQQLERAFVVVLFERLDDLGQLPGCLSSASSRSAAVGPVSSSRNCATAAGGCAPTNSRTTSPSRNAFTAGIPWIW